GQSSTLRLSQEGRELWTKRVLFDQDRGRVELQVPLEFHAAGRQRYRLQLDPLPEERTERNNTREISIEGLQHRIRVVPAGAHPDWDTAFWARTLRDDPNVQLTAVMLAATRTWRRDNGATFEWPRGAAWGRDFDLYILGPVRGALRADAATEL